jgi:GDP-L-fucose synthase
MEKNARIYVAGDRGMVGSALVRLLERQGYANLITRSRDQLDLLDQNGVNEFFTAEKPDYVLLAAAKVGGIRANDSYPAEFLHDNLAIQTNVIHAAWRAGVRKLLFLGSSCIYPRLAPQPMKEEHLLTGPLEPTNQWYAIAKIAGLKMVEAYRRQYGFRGVSLMPTNLYGPGDNFHLESSHVLPALLRRFHDAKLQAQQQVTVWGSGKPRREFLHVDDLASAALFLMDSYDGEQIVNVGTGTDLTIAELACLIRDAVGYPGQIVYDPTVPDGAPRKLLDVSRLAKLGWKARIGLEEGIPSTYRWFLRHQRTTARL